MRELLSARRRAVEAVFVARTLESSPIVDEIVDLAQARGVLHVVHTSEIDALARSEVPQGVVARAEPLRPWSLDEVVIPRDGTPPFLVVLDGITDPHNFGAILRSAVCAGATGAVCARHRSVHVTPVVAKAAAGAIEHLPISVVAGIPNAVSQLQDSGIWTVGLAADGETSIDDLPISALPIALIFGSEGRGLGQLTRQRCEVRARITLAGPLESLNVSAAAAVACFAVSRQRTAEATAR